MPIVGASVASSANAAANSSGGGMIVIAAPKAASSANATANSSGGMSVAEALIASTINPQFWIVKDVPNATVALSSGAVASLYSLCCDDQSLPPLLVKFASVVKSAGDELVPPLRGDPATARISARAASVSTPARFGVLAVAAPPVAVAGRLAFVSKGSSISAPATPTARIVASSTLPPEICAVIVSAVSAAGACAHQISRVFELLLRPPAHWYCARRCHDKPAVSVTLPTGR